MIKVSDRLKNGATVVAIKDDLEGRQIALCWWQGEYISCVVDRHGHRWQIYYHGQCFKQAVKDFEER